jgi:hypothetical protein
MYFCRQPAPERAARALRGLYLSLNTPVVAIEDLAVGPARAAIALPPRDESGARPLLVLRSQRSGQLACFAPDAPPEDEAGTQIALDGALSFAESMGFVFDDDPVAGLGADGPRQAALAWNELLGLEPRDPGPQTGPAAVPAAPASVELWLDEPVAPPPPARPPVLLTKFRRTAASGRGRRNGWPIRLLSHF